MQIKPDRIVFPDNTEQFTAAGGSGGGGDSFIAGMIMMWSGSIASIPSGWYLCDGTNNTPDLRNRFIIGANADDAGTAKTNVTGAATDTGGSKNAIVVAHTHTGTTSTEGNHVHSIQLSGLNTAEPRKAAKITAGSDGHQTSGAGGNYLGTAGNHNHTFTTSSSGSSGTNANLPPYFALAFIMKGEII